MVYFRENPAIKWMILRHHHGLETSIFQQKRSEFKKGGHNPVTNHLPSTEQCSKAFLVDDTWVLYHPIQSLGIIMIHELESDAQPTQWSTIMDTDGNPHRQISHEPLAKLHYEATSTNWNDISQVLNTAKCSKYGLFTYMYPKSGPVLVNIIPDSDIFSYIIPTFGHIPLQLWPLTVIFMGLFHDI